MDPALTRRSLIAGLIAAGVTGAWSRNAAQATGSVFLDEDIDPPPPDPTGIVALAAAGSGLVAVALTETASQLRALDPITSGYQVGAVISDLPTDFLPAGVAPTPSGDYLIYGGEWYTYNSVTFDDGGPDGYRNGVLIFEGYTSPGPVTVDIVGLRPKIYRLDSAGTLNTMLAPPSDARLAMVSSHTGESKCALSFSSGVEISYTDQLRSVDLSIPGPDGLGPVQQLSSEAADVEVILLDTGLAVIQTVVGEVNQILSILNGLTGGLLAPDLTDGKVLAVAGDPANNAIVATASGVLTGWRSAQPDVWQDIPWTGSLPTQVRGISGPSEPLFASIDEIGNVVPFNIEEGTNAGL